jgi:hypothetical protein
MIRPKRSSLAPILALVIASISAEARAGFITYTVSTPTEVAANSGMTLAVPSFDSSLGTLQSITLSFSDSANLAGTVVNNSASAQTFSVSADVSFSVTFQGTQVLTNDLNATRTYTQLAAGATANFGTYSLVGASGITTILDPSQVTGFVDNTTMDVLFSMTTLSGVNGGDGSPVASFQNMVNGSVTIGYNFAPNVVPEPASLAMTALGGLLAAAFVRNRARPSL